MKHCLVFSSKDPLHQPSCSNVIHPMVLIRSLDLHDLPESPETFLIALRFDHNCSEVIWHVIAERDRWGDLKFESFVPVWEVYQNVFSNRRKITFICQLFGNHMFDFVKKAIGKWNILWNLWRYFQFSVSTGNNKHVSHINNFTRLRFC